MKQIPAPRRTIDRRIIGTPEHVRQTVQLAAASGRLVHVSPWHETPEGVQVTVRLMERPAPPSPPARRRWPLIAGAGVAVTALGVAAYAVVQLVNAVIAAFPLILAGLLVLAGIALISRGGRSRTFTGTFTGRMD